MLSRFLIAIQFVLKGGNDSMAMVYVTLIVKGAKTYEDVPSTLKAQVREILADLEMEYLVAVG